MSRLDHVLFSIQNRKGAPRRDLSKSFGKDRLGKSVDAVRKSLNISKSLQNSEMDLFKGVHDAMYHHAVHAEAAERGCYPTSSSSTDADKVAKCKQAASKHMFMFLRHALENARTTSPRSMRSALSRAIEYYTSESYNAMYPDEFGNRQAVSDHFLNGGDFVPHEDDSNFIEDYKK